MEPWLIVYAGINFFCVGLVIFFGWAFARKK